VIPRLARDLGNELPEVKGFSERNISRMIAFFREYQAWRTILPQPVAKLGAGDKTSHSASATSILPQAVAKLRMGNEAPILQQAVAKLEMPGQIEIVQQLVAQLPWGHNVRLLDKVSSAEERLWYVRELSSTVGVATSWRFT
jgi:hypothetical protein